MSLFNLRNIGIIAHIDAGKTTTTERILYYTGKTHKIGEVHDGTAVMDWMEQEQERGISITAACTYCEWEKKHKKYFINIIDTPGHIDFTAEVERSLRVLDGVVVVVCGVSSVQPQTLTVWNQSENHKIPKLIFINKLDREGSDFFKVVSDAKKIFNINPAVINYPYYSKDNLEGVVDVVEKKIIFFEDGKEINSTLSLDRDNTLKTEKIRTELFNLLGESNDQILESVIQGHDPEKDIIYSEIRKLTLKGTIVPFFSGSAYKNKGIQPLLDGITEFLPNPFEIESNFRFAFEDKEELVVFVFKVQSESYTGFLTYLKIYSGCLRKSQVLINSRTQKKERILKILRIHSNKKSEIEEANSGDIIAVVGLNNVQTGDTLTTSGKKIFLEEISFKTPVIGVSIETTKKTDSIKLEKVIEIVTKEDPSLSFFKDKETGQIILSGMGELHIDVAIKKIESDFNVGIKRGKQRVSLKEKPSKTLKKSYSLEKTINALQLKISFDIVVTPLMAEKNSENELFVSKIESRSSPVSEDQIYSLLKNFLLSGVHSGYPIIQTRIEINNFQISESNSEAEAISLFSISSSIREIFLESKIKLMEPVMDVVISSDETHLSSILKDINSRSAEIKNIGGTLSRKIIHAEIPLSRMLGFMTVLRSLTKGEADYTMEHKGYKAVKCIA